MMISMNLYLDNGRLAPPDSHCFECGDKQKDHIFDTEENDPEGRKVISCEGWECHEKHKRANSGCDYWSPMSF